MPSTALELAGGTNGLPGVRQSRLILPSKVIGSSVATIVGALLVGWPTAAWP